MSKDPFEQLFGDLESAPQPVPARERLAQEKAERLASTSPLPTGGAPVQPKREKQDNPAKPWVIVGAIAAVAIAASALVINMVRSDETPQPAATATPTPSPTPTPTAPAEKDDVEDEEPDTGGVPEVEVGPTNTMPIGPWDATSELSQRFGSTSFNIPDGVNLVLTNDLLNSFPESCAAMRGEWGATKADGGKYEVLKPATKCQDAPELYDEVWGLIDAWVKTIRPA